jgi:hypothetical protein
MYSGGGGGGSAPPFFEGVECLEEGAGELEEVDRYHWYL